MKATFFILILLKFTYILTKQKTINASNTSNEDSTSCLDNEVIYPQPLNNTEINYDYCRSLYFDKDKYYRCCYMEDDNGKGCVATQYIDFQSEDSIKKYINNTSNGKIDCGAKYLGVSLLVLLAALF